jgi:hypothetical protein
MSFKLNSDITRIVIVILAFVAILFALQMYSNKKAKSSGEGFSTSNNQMYMLPQETNDSYNGVRAGEQMGYNEVYKPVSQEDMSANELPSDCYPKDKLTADDLLPKDSNSKWAQVNPAGQGDIRDQNFLNAGFLIGINTVGQSLKNANLQLRSEPPNPQLKVSPWNQSTIDPDLNRKPLEIGGCA